MENKFVQELRMGSRENRTCRRKKPRQNSVIKDFRPNTAKKIEEDSISQSLHYDHDEWERYLSLARVHHYASILGTSMIVVE